MPHLHNGGICIYNVTTPGITQGGFRSEVFLQLLSVPPKVTYSTRNSHQAHQTQKARKRFGSKPEQAHHRYLEQLDSATLKARQPHQVKSAFAIKRKRAPPPPSSVAGTRPGRCAPLVSQPSTAETVGAAPGRDGNAGMLRTPTLPASLACARYAPARIWARQLAVPAPAV